MLQDLTIWNVVRDCVGFACISETASVVLLLFSRFYRRVPIEVTDVTTLDLCAGLLPPAASWCPWTCRGEAWREDVMGDNAWLALLG